MKNVSDEPLFCTWEEAAEAIAVLDQDLRDAAVIRAADDFEEPERLAAQAALRGCINFVSRFSRWRTERLVLPLIELQQALLDLDANHVAPMLRPKIGPGRPSSVNYDTFRGIAAGVMGGLMAKGDGRKTKAAAAAWVADRFKDAGHHDVTATAVASWRKTAMEEPKSFLAERYAATLAVDWSDRLGRAERIIARLIEYRRAGKK